MLVYIVAILTWGTAIFTNMLLLAMINNKQIDFQNFFTNNKLSFIAMTLAAPFVTMIFGVIILYKSSISLVNKVCCPKSCKTCTNRLANECSIYELTIKPSMMCKGAFYTDSQISQNSPETVETGNTIKRKSMKEVSL